MRNHQMLQIPLRNVSPLAVGLHGRVLRTEQLYTTSRGKKEKQAVVNTDEKDKLLTSK